MSNRKKLSTRRQQPAKEGNIIRAITKKSRNSKHRAVATNPTAGFKRDESNLSNTIVWGLFILLAFHVVAVGAIVFHSKFYQGGESGVELAPPAPISHGSSTETASERIQRERSDKTKANQLYEWVYAGDTYQTVADRKGVDVNELKKINKNKALQAGTNLKLPQRTIEVKSPALEGIGSGQALKVETVAGGAQVITDGSYEIEVSRVRPAQDAQSRGNFRVHTFAKGETFWALSKKYGVSVDAIQRANPKMSPTKIRVGDKINIPR